MPFRLPDFPLRFPSFRKHRSERPETPKAAVPGQARARAVTDPPPGAATAHSSATRPRAATDPTPRSAAERPRIGPPMNPRPWGLPVISPPMNPRPYGLPDPGEGRATAPRPVGPNYWLKMRGRDPGLPEGISPNYPASYTYRLGEEGRYGGPSIKSGPSLLHPDYKVEGPVDYGKTADARLPADLGMYAAARFGSQVSAGIVRGFPSGPDGKPTLPFDTPFAGPPKARPTEGNTWGLPGPEAGPDLATLFPSAGR